MPHRRLQPMPAPHRSAIFAVAIRVACLLLALVTATLDPADTHAQRGEIAPEAATGTTGKSLAMASRHMVSAANPYAAEAGREILRAGGSAIDAAIATQLVLGLVEPQSSGLGGGGFILHFDAASKDLQSYDGRETAPAAARPDRFLKDGRPLPFDTGVHSGLSVGVPGLARLMEHAHKRHGVLPWTELFQPAIRLAEQGFAISTRLNLLLRWMGAASFDAGARRYFFDDQGSPRPIGETLKNPAYAETLRAMAERGASAFHEGPIADAIVTAVQAAPNAPGDLTIADIRSYEVITRPPLCSTYRRYRICGMGPPSSGGIVVAQTLAMIEAFDLGLGTGVGRGNRAPGDGMSAHAMHLVAEAQKLSYADRDRYIADPAFVTVPEGLLDPAYLAQRGGLIDRGRAMPQPQAGEPPGARRQAFGVDATIESVGTTHFSVIDAAGNAVAMTSTIEAAFGSRLWAAGFLLNNELTDFSFMPADRDGRAIANRVEPKKRPRSSMAPTIVFDPSGRVFAVLGSPGGARIPLYVIKTLVALIDWRLDAQQAVAVENFGSRGGPFEIEIGWRTVWHALRLSALGHAIQSDLLTSGVHVIVRRGDKLEGGADPRREGIAVGD